MNWANTYSHFYKRKEPAAEEVEVEVEVEVEQA
jgi:hypothetical protein